MQSNLSDLNTTGLKILAIKTPYSDNFEKDILFKKELEPQKILSGQTLTLPLSENERALLSNDYPTEFYLIDGNQNLVTSTRFFP